MIGGLRLGKGGILRQQGGIDRGEGEQAHAVRLVLRFGIRCQHAGPFQQPKVVGGKDRIVLYGGVPQGKRPFLPPFPQQACRFAVLVRFGRPCQAVEVGDAFLPFALLVP